MNETNPTTIEKSRYLLPIEQQANYEGSWTNLMIERCKDIIIKKQILNLLIEQEQIGVGDLLRFDFERNEEGEVIYNENGEPKKNIKHRKRKNKDEITEELEKNLILVQSSTPISFIRRMPSGQEGPERREIIHLGGYADFDQLMVPNFKQLNIIEAHEKGHVLRDFNVLYANPDRIGGVEICLANKFVQGFDFSHLGLSEGERVYFEKLSRVDGNSVSNTSFAYRMSLVNYLNTPFEEAERMSQLKNYFGFRGSEKFTKEHLAYARKHYIEDTGFDNNMTQFFQVITPEKEDAFIEIINSAGI